jgi:6-pyruvoyltetrahydropterin/6-carboxytetrahydropterin synthase
MTTTIAKEFRWEMAHRLASHNGLCRNLHGHSYRLVVELEAALNPDGMVMDFYDVKSIVTPLVERLDHAFLCDRSDTVMVDFLEQQQFKTAYMDAPTTTENLAVWILRELAPAFRAHPSFAQGLRRLKIRVHETRTAYAEVEEHF